MDASTIVRRIRMDAALTRSRLAQLAGVSPSTVTRIERGELDPTWGTLQKLLESTGMRINGNTIASSGDPSAISSARAVLECKPSTSRWAQAWQRAGWAPVRTAEDVLGLCTVAGNAGMFARRPQAPLYVTPNGSWQDLARAIGDSGMRYAVSGLVAARADRVTSSAAAPIIYVDDPQPVMQTLSLAPAAPLRGVMLAPAADSEMDGAMLDSGIWFVAPAQAMLDAFASGGRQPDKAEALALSWPVLSA